MEASERQRILESAGVQFCPGLTDDEVVAVQRRYGFVFPPDLRDFLSYALPVSAEWVDWRNGDEDAIRDRLNQPFDGMCFDVEYNGFWCRSWGARPAELDQAFAIVRRMLDEAPTLIPVFSHRYMPERPSSPGNPVFSVVQTDIIYYGCDLQNYLENEFFRYFGSPRYNIGPNVREIELWSALATDGDC